VRSHHKCAQTPATGRGTIRAMDDDLAELGDLDGLARLVRQAIEAVERIDLPDEQRQDGIAEIEEQYELAVDAASGPTRPRS